MFRDVLVAFQTAVLGKSVAGNGGYAVNVQFATVVAMLLDSMI